MLGLWVCDNDVVLSESDVEGFVTNGALDLYAGSTMNGEGLVTTSTDQDSLAGLACNSGDIVKYDSVLGLWFCDNDAMLSEADVEM